MCVWLMAPSSELWDVQEGSGQNHVLTHAQHFLNGNECKNKQTGVYGFRVEAE